MLVISINIQEKAYFNSSSSKVVLELDEIYNCKLYTSDVQYIYCEFLETTAAIFFFLNKLHAIFLQCREHNIQATVRLLFQYSFLTYSNNYSNSVETEQN